MTSETPMSSTWPVDEAIVARVLTIGTSIVAMVVPPP